MNELFSLIMLLFNFAVIMFAFRRWGRLGLYVWIPISVIIANIQVTKNVELLGLEATLGNIVFTSGALATDLLNEFYGPRHARRAVGIGFFSLVVMTGFMQVALWFTPASSDMAQEALSRIFGIMPRIAGASLAAYLVSNMFDIKVFAAIRGRFPGRRSLWFRKNVSTWASQFVDSLIFTFGAFWGVYETSVLWQILLTTCVFKWAVASLDTPFMYLGRKWVDAGYVSAADEKCGMTVTAGYDGR
ncbi:queuosine precursor transporter [Parasphaerochaeta coccoides]|uniref:Probable queuosine precursor transporter n=1 Tax=Parasphaerochaeta coccoides (strain ATCC BAA-1237 / DSM 17374 / SPN1) TaxID=760011 RepID=F4GKZ1_PARC1|nr:queuosine precursor transporter [Parasphaerochaeta coccoides]AEC01904.1 protein of unknown function DUF165 [Parasphaerochaeta coccoides DSM 17374]